MKIINVIKDNRPTSTKIFIDAEIFNVPIRLEYYYDNSDYFVTMVSTAKLDKLMISRNLSGIKETKRWSKKTRGQYKKLLASLRRKYGLTRKQWQKIMGTIGDFLDKPLRFLARHGVYSNKATLYELYKNDLI